MKKVLIATGIAALALVSIAGAQGYMFNTNLTVGSTGPDVVALQTALMSAGYDIPAITSGAAAKGYFGSQTKAAAMAYQAARGIPNTGFVGPLTRGALNSGAGVSGSVSCPVGYNCTPTTPIAVACPIGFICTPIGGGTPTTGGTTGITTPGAEGIITTKLASNPISDANVRDIAMVPVYGIEVKAQGSDMVVDRVLLQVQLSVGTEATSESNPGSFVRKIYAYDGSTLLRSWDVSTADFNRDSSDRYYFIATGINFVVPRDATKVLTFKMDVAGVSSDQSSRIVSVQGYAGNTQNVRAIDGAGLNTYTDMSGEANERDQTFTTSGTSALTVTTNSSLTPKSTNNKVDSTDGIDELLMHVFDIKSTTGQSIVKKVCVAANATTTTGLPTTLYLYDGSSLLGSVNAGTTDGAQSCFSDLTLAIAKDQTKQLTVKADFDTDTSGQAASTSLASTGVFFEKPDSTTASSTNSELAGNSQYLFSAAPQWSIVGTPTISSTAGVVGVASSSITGTIVLKATAIGGALTKPVTGDFDVRFGSSSPATAYTDANSVTGSTITTVSPSDATVGEGGSYTVTISSTVASNDSEIGSSQNLFMVVNSIDSVTGGITITNQTWGVFDTFFTPPAYLSRGTF